MSCYTTDDTRITIKYSTITGQEPTIPLSDDHSDGTWLPTDIYIGEIFMNSSDDKLWIRTDNGIMPIGGTGSGTFSFIGDYVHISGGTYSGTVYAPTFSASGITASYIISDLFEGNFNGTFVGDGSGLTGIVADWLGGTVSNPVHFVNTVDLNNTTYLNGTVTTTNPYINIDSEIWVTGVSASYFIGDGSGLTNIPLGTQSDTYTETAELSGNSIVFTRTDSATYDVDLTPLLATQSIGLITWDEINNILNIELVGGEVISTTIDTFTNLSSLTSISAPTFYGGDFFGSFTGTFSGTIDSDIYTSTATLYGDELVFDRTNGSSYSVDLSTLNTGGATGLGGVLTIDNNTNGNDINLNDGDQIISDDTQKIIEFQEERILIQNEYTTTEYTYTGLLEVKNDFRTSQLAHIRTDLTSGDTLTTGVQIDDTTATITSNNVTTYNEAFVRADSGSGTVPQAEVRLWASDFYGNVSYMNMNPGYIEVVGSSADGFSGIEYGDDYSADYTNRSLVDKEYVDNAVVIGSSGTLEHTLMNGNTTGTQSIYISSSASQINGYNGVSQHWYDAVNPLAGNYFRIENGTGSSASFIQLMDNLRGDIHIYQGRYWDTSSDDAFRTSMYMGGNTQIATENRDFLTNTFWNKSIAAVVGNATSNETRDLLNDTSAQVATYTDGTGTDTHVLIQSYHGGGAVAGQIYVRQNELTLKAEDNNISSSNITMDYTTLLLEAKDLDLDTGTSIEMMSTFISVAGTNPTFQGIEYSTDYSANFTNRTLVDKEYVDNLTNGFIPIVSALETFRGRTFRVDSTTIDTYGGIDTLNNASSLGLALSSTNFYNKITRLRYYASIVQTGRQTDIRGTDLQWYRGTGFRFVTTFRVADTAYGSTCQQFYGLGGYTTQLPYGGAGTTQLSTLLNLIGVGSEAADTNLQVFHNDGTGTCTKIDLGSSFPANRTAGAEMTTMYSIEIYNGNNQTDVKYRVKNLETGVVAQGTITTDLPATTQGLAIFASRVMGTPTTNTGQFEINRWGCYDIIYS